VKKLNSKAADGLITDKRGEMMFCRRFLLVLVLLTPGLVAAPARAGDAARAMAATESYIATHEGSMLDEFSALLRLPNRASDDKAIRANAGHIRAMMERRGIDARLLEVAGSPPAVYGELTVPGAKRTVVFYAHYDGQPVAPENWDSPPFSPTLRNGRLDRGATEARPPATGRLDPDWRLYARSASDDKAAVFGLMAALDALRAQNLAPSVNLKFFFEGEEEAGSPHLSAMLKAHQALLAADLWIFCDGPVHASGKNQITFGVRGSTGFDLTVYGPARPVHSGHYGNFAANPITRLAALITSMRAADSHILIDGYYDAVVPPTAAELAAVAAAPGSVETMREDLGIATSESDGKRLEEAILWPALNLRGIRAGNIGAAAANVILPSATASIGLRLVPDLTPQSVRPLIEAHIRAQGYFITHRAPTAGERKAHGKIARIDWQGGYPGVRTALDHPASQALIGVMKAATGGDIVIIPTSGGSLPIWYIREILDVPLVMLPIANHDNNQHGHDENIRLGNLWRGIGLYAATYAAIGENLK